MRSLHVVKHNLFRSDAPSNKDVSFLNDNFNVSRIISLDEKSGKNIEKHCKDLNIDHKIIDLHPGDTSSVSNLFQYNIDDLIDPDAGTLVHCARGKDRTGFFIALVRCILDGWNAPKAIKEAKTYGFGTGLNFPVEKFYVQLIRKSAEKEKKDQNNLQDIVQNQRDNNSIVRDESLDPYGYSFAPYGDIDNKYPGANFIDQQVRSPFSTRQDLTQDEDLRFPEFGFNREYTDDSVFPQTGAPSEVFQITNSAGPSVLSGGFL